MGRGGLDILPQEEAPADGDEGWIATPVDVALRFAAGLLAYLNMPTLRRDEDALDLANSGGWPASPGGASREPRELV